MQKRYAKPLTTRAAMLGESKGNSELCLNEPPQKGKTKMLTSTSCWLPG